jgi:hypothetical protein
MELKLTIRTTPQLAEIARDVSARFLESGGHQADDASRMGGAVMLLVGRAASEHPVVGCEMTLHLVSVAGLTTIVSSYPAGGCGPGAAAGSWDAERMPEGIEAAFDETDCRTEAGIRICRFVRHASGRS